MESGKTLEVMSVQGMPIGGRTKLERPRWLALGLALGLGMVLIRSAMFHIENSYAFLLVIDSYRLLPSSAAAVAAAVVPYFQLTLGLMLLFFPKHWRTAFGWCAGLFLLFTLAQVFNYVRGLNISCGCFAPSDDNPIGLRSIGLAAGATVAAVIGAFETAQANGPGHADPLGSGLAIAPAPSPQSRHSM